MRAFFFKKKPILFAGFFCLVGVIVIMRAIDVHVSQREALLRQCVTLCQLGLDVQVGAPDANLDELIAEFKKRLPEDHSRVHVYPSDSYWTIASQGIHAPRITVIPR